MAELTGGVRRAHEIISNQEDVDDMLKLLALENTMEFVRQVQIAGASGEAVDKLNEKSMKPLTPSILKRSADGPKFNKSVHDLLSTHVQRRLFS